MEVLFNHSGVEIKKFIC